jgi:DNA transformation protein
MDRADIEDLFAGVARVGVKRMFGGQGVYAGGRMVALEAGGVLYMKVDDVTRPAFEAAGSEPFTYEARGRTMRIGYWRLPEAAFDDAEALRGWFDLACDAAERAAAAKAGATRPRRTRRGRSP